MKTGSLGFLEECGCLTDEQNEIIEKVIIIFTIKSFELAKRYIDECNRNCVTDKDLLIALKYMAMTFFQTIDLESEILKLDEESEESTEESEQEEESDEEYTEGTTDFCINIHNRIKDWDQWNPEDLAERILYDSVNNTKKKFDM